MSFIQKIFNSYAENDRNFFVKISKLIGFKPKDLSIYKTAFTHRSLNLTNSKGFPVNYERLEFLGDAMLSSIIANHLYVEVPSGDEGYLTKMRSKIVSRQHLNELGKKLNLLDFVQSKIPKTQFGVNIHGNLFESLVGAIYLDKGYKACEKFIYNTIIIPYVDIPKLEGKVISYKSLLLNGVKKRKKALITKFMMILE